jgi:hypothetical protein
MRTSGRNSETFQKGFQCGLEDFTLSHTSIPPNHFTSQDDEEFVVSKYVEEMKLGRISHGYDPKTLFSLIGHFRTAPLTVITQDSSKRCVIVNHSYPKNKDSVDLDSLTHDDSAKYIIDPSKTSSNTLIDSNLNALGDLSQNATY